MNPQECAAAVAEEIGRLGSEFMWHPDTMARGQELGHTPWGFYYGGRAGVLGDCDAEVVRAAFVFFPARSIEKGWGAASAAMPAGRTVQEYAECCRAWGRTHLSGVEGLERLAELMGRVVDAADPAGLPLFAGWRALPRPDDAPAAVAQLAMALREHRGGLHCTAVLASGLEPLQAVVAGPYGTSNAKFFGWPEPWPDPAPYVERWAEAERRTNELAARAYEVLDEAERAEYVELVTRATAALGGQTASRMLTRG